MAIPTLDPNQLADPAAQQKIAENVLNQLGLHPNQQGARSLLDTHFQSGQAVPEIKSIVQPLVSGTASDTAPLKEEAAAPPKTPSVTPEAPKPAAETAVQPTAPKINIPAPSSSSLIGKNTSDRTLKDQSELSRLIDTGSGISQVHNPFLRTLGRVGEVALNIFNPAASTFVPGTEAHHNMLIRNQEGLLNQDINQAAKEASTEHIAEETEKIKNAPFNPNELGTWMEQNPGKPLDEYWKQRASALGLNAKITPQENVMKYLTMSPEEGGLGMSPMDAFTQINTVMAGLKPKTSAQQESEMEALIAKAMPNGQMNPAVMSDPDKLINLIGSSPQLTNEEKSQIFSHLVLKSTPASQGAIATIRTAPQYISRLNPAIDTTNGTLAFVNPGMVNSNPGRYIPATQGSQAMSKEQAFADIDFNIKNMDEAIDGLKHGLDDKTRAQFLLAMRSNDPHKSFNQFLSSEVAQTLTSDQVDYLTAVAGLNENALALRSIQGLGQGSDELRAAITRMVPGPGTPSTDYAKRQMELFKGMVERAKQGVPHTGIQHPEITPPKTTEEIHNAPKGPEVGTIKKFQGKDWKFKGGNWKDKNNWEEVTNATKK